MAQKWWRSLKRAKSIFNRNYKRSIWTIVPSFGKKKIKVFCFQVISCWRDSNSVKPRIFPIISWDFARILSKESLLFYESLELLCGKLKIPGNFHDKFLRQQENFYLNSAKTVHAAGMREREIAIKKCRLAEKCGGVFNYKFIYKGDHS